MNRPSLSRACVTLALLSATAAATPAAAPLPAVDSTAPAAATPTAAPAETGSEATIQPVRMHVESVTETRTTLPFRVENVVLP